MFKVYFKLLSMFWILKFGYSILNEKKHIMNHIGESVTFDEKVPDIDNLFVCDETKAVKIQEFVISQNNSLKCYDDMLYISFEIINFDNETTKMEAFMRQSGGCVYNNQYSKKRKCKKIKK